MRVEVKQGKSGQDNAAIYFLSCACGWDKTVFTEAGAEVLGQDHLSQNHRSNKDNQVVFLQKREHHAE